MLGGKRGDLLRSDFARYWFSQCKLNCDSDRKSSLGQGAGIWCLIQNDKIKLIMAQYRIRGSLSQWYTPTQRFTEYPLCPWDRPSITVKFYIGIQLNLPLQTSAQYRLLHCILQPFYWANYISYNFDYLHIIDASIIQTSFTCLLFSVQMYYRGFDCFKHMPQTCIIQG